MCCEHPAGQEDPKKWFADYLRLGFTKRKWEVRECRKYGPAVLKEGRLCETSVERLLWELFSLEERALVTRRLDGLPQGHGQKTQGFSSCFRGPSEFSPVPSAQNTQDVCTACSETAFPVLH